MAFIVRMNVIFVQNPRDPSQRTRSLVICFVVRKICVPVIEINNCTIHTTHTGTINSNSNILNVIFGSSSTMSVHISLLVYLLQSMLIRICCCLLPLSLIIAIIVGAAAAVALFLYHVSLLYQIQCPFPISRRLRFAS